MRVGFMGAVAGSAGMMTLLMASQVLAQDTAASDKTPTTVVVTGAKQAVVQKIDRTVYDLKENPQAATGSVSDVLSTLPSVNVDTNGNVSVRGASVQVMVDGKPSAALKGANLASALQSMPANTIAKIEVVTNPGAEFHTDAATVINIITKRAGGKAPTGSLIVNGGPQARYNATLSGSAGFGKWTFNGSVSLRQDQRVNLIDVDRITNSPATHMVQNGHVKVRINMAVLDATAAYAATDNDTLSLSANATARSRPRRDRDHIAFLSPTGTIIGDSTTYAHGRQYFNTPSLTGTWKHTGKRDGETLTIQARHQEDDNLRDYNYDEVFSVPASLDNLYRRSRSEREFSDDINGDYILPLAEDVQFKTGFDIEYDRIQDYNLSTSTHPTTGVTSIDAPLTHRFLIDQTLSAAYIDYQHPVGKWVAEGGLRIENMHTRQRQSRTAPFIETSDVQWSPSLYLSRTLTPKTKLRLSYSHRIERPQPDQLNPLESPLTAQDVQIGNPYLKPSQTESFEAGYDYTTKPVSFTATLYARQLRDTLTEYNYYRNPGDTILVTTYVNAGKGDDEGLDMSLNLHPSTKIGWSLASDIFHVSQTTTVSGVTVTQSLMTHHSKASLTLNPTTADSFQFQAQINGKTPMALGTSSGFNMLNVSYSHKFSPRLKLVITGNDVLNTVRFNQLIQSPQFRDRTRITIPGQVFYIGIDYKLGAVKG